MRLRRLLAVAAVCSLANVAHAAPDAGVAAGEDPSPAIDADPGAGLHLITSSALTQPRGAVTITSHMGLTGATYGLTDRLELGGYVLPVFLFSDDTYVGGVFTAKLAVVNHGPIRAAIEVRTGALSQRWTDLWYAEASAIATACIDRACASELTAAGTIGARAVTGSLDDGGGERELETRLAIGAQVRLADHVKLVADVAWAREAERGGSASSGVLLAPGVRIHGASWMVLASAAIAPMSGDILPWVSAAYRL
ncbi:MAG: hypothetical protein K8W52_37360 [Deltaproteobacteria bacterium]|nr:hypothetical protein [Deltaproteobacteria bacterium]